MTEIRITPKAQMLGLLGVAGLIAAAVVAQLPELRRYLKIGAM
jgi:hypothetical protein